MDKKIPINNMISPYKKSIIDKWSDKFVKGEIYEIKRKEKTGMGKSYDGGYYNGRQMQFIDFIGHDGDILLFKDVKNGIKETVLMIELEMISGKQETINSVEIQEVS